MSTSNLLGLTELASTMNDRSVLLNLWLAVIEALAGHIPAIVVDGNTPPGSPAEGNVYITGAAPTGAWAGQANKIAIYYNAAWDFRSLREGITAYDQTADSLLFWTGSAWAAVASAGGGAPNSADYLVKTANGSLSAERVVTDSTTVVADWSTAGVVKFNIVGGGSATVPTDFKDSVAVASTANLTLSGEQTIDGILTSASRILVKDQSTGSQNGLYVTAAGAWSRSTDADTSAEVTPGMLVLVEGGTVNGDQVFILTTNGTIILDTTALSFQAIAVPANVFVGKTVSGTTYTTILTDSTKRLYATNAGTKTITIARQAVVNHAVNTEIEICNIGAGLLTIAPDTGVTLNSLSSILTVPQYHCVKAKKRASPNTWEVTSVLGTSAAMNEATPAEVRSAAADKVLTAELIESASAFVALTDAATVALDWDTGINFTLTIGGNRTLGNPTNGQPGTWRTIIITQDGTGSRTLAYGNQYQFPGGTEPVLTTTPTTGTDVLNIFCVTASLFYVFSAADMKV